MRFRPKYAVVAGGAAAALLVAGCGSSGSPLAAKHGNTNAVLAAYQTTMKAKSARIAIKETVTAADHTETLAGRGVASMNQKSGEFSLTIPNLGALHEVVLMPNVYVELPAALRSQLPGDKQWLAINVDKVTQSKLGASLSQLSSSSQDSTNTLAQLGDVSSNGVKKVGSATVAGVATTEYRANIDLSKADASKPAAVRTAVQKLETMLGHRVLPVKVWVDAQGRVRQISYSVSITKDGQNVSVAALMTITAFNVPVHVTAPPASETFNITDKVLNSGSSGL